METKHRQKVKLAFSVSCFLLLIDSLLFTSNVKAQINWAPDGAVWTYSQTHMFSLIIDTIVIRSIGDTVIQDKECKILKRSAGTCDLRPWKEYMFADSGKVFFYDVLRNDFQMLYDFNAEAGQSWPICTTYEGSSASSDTITVTIDSVKSILLNGVMLKKQFVRYSSSEWSWIVCGPGINIEGIGNTGSMFPWYYGFCDANWAGPLRCYSDDFIGLVDFGTAPSCDYVGLGINDEEPNEYLKVFPNPADDFVVFEASMITTGSITVVDIFGREFIKVPITGEKTVWDTRGVAPGVYLYRIGNSSFAYSGKVVIVR
jgi:hypothetical protein